MTTAIETRERRRLTELAREYRERGYEVITQPQEDDLPAFLRGFQPDMVARREGDDVVIEVVTKQSLRETSQRIKQLTDAVAPHAGWRFELVVTNPRTDSSEPPHGDEPAIQEIMKRLGDARELLREGQAENAGLVAWAATEAALRSLARRHDVSLDRLEPGYVLKQLSVLGLLSSEDLDLMQDAMRERDLIAHGFLAEPGAEDWVRPLIERTSGLVHG
ncbi:MAG TPA: hypothetical protein VMM78_14615 [Thermomicrobiales bacterium]|nr:hypothetical protein [Thermomicrobiales bacterium]